MFVPVINSVDFQHISLLSFHLDTSLVQVKWEEKDQIANDGLHVKCDATRIGRS